MSSSALNKRL